MSSAELEKTVDIGNKMTAAKYYSIAVTAILFYDFFLTLADEIEYAWKGRKSWVFAIFVANRYFPIGYHVWWLYTSYNATFHQELYECDKTAFLEVLATVVPTLLAQVVLTLRIYAVTNKNRVITSCFSILTISQFSFGLYMTAHAAKAGSSQILPVPLPVYMTCTPVWQLFTGVVFITMTLAYDVLAFSVIVFLVVRSNVANVPLPSILKTIARDATYYFLVIFTSHLVTAMFFWFASNEIKLIPSLGNPVYLPVMITRLLFSLRKANASQEHGWSFWEPTTHTTMRFAERRGGGTTIDATYLDTFVITHEETRIQERLDGIKDVTGRSGDLTPA